MTDSDIKRSCTIDAEWIDCHMRIPKGAVKEKAWHEFGEFMKMEGPSEDVLERMAEFIRKAKS